MDNITRDNAIRKLASEKLNSWSIDKLSSREIRCFWDYKKEKLNLKQARDILKNEWNRQADIRKNRFINSHYKEYEKKSYLYLYFEMNRRRKNWERKIKNTPEASCLNLKAGGPVKIKDRIYQVNFDEDKDWNYYAKSYKYPKVTIEGRRVERLEFDINKPNCYAVTKSVNVAAFRGDFFINSIAKMEKIRPVKYKGIKKRIQLNPYCRVVKIKKYKDKDIDIYKRTFCGELFDYCAVSKNTTYHAHTIEGAIEGLKYKIYQKNPDPEKYINKKIALGFGFCETGIKQFCIDNDICINKTYKISELKKIVLSNPWVNEKYQPELKTIGIY